MILTSAVRSLYAIFLPPQFGHGTNIQVSAEIQLFSPQFGHGTNIQVIAEIQPGDGTNIQVSGLKHTHIQTDAIITRPRPYPWDEVIIIISEPHSRNATSSLRPL